MNFFHFLAQNHQQVLELTLEHLWLVGISTILADHRHPARDRHRPSYNFKQTGSCGGEYYSNHS